MHAFVKKFGLDTDVLLDLSGDRVAEPPDGRRAARFVRLKVVVSANSLHRKDSNVAPGMTRTSDLRFRKTRRCRV